MSIHIGQVIKNYLDNNRISHPAFATMIGKHKSGIGRYFLMKDMHTSLLNKVCEKLNHNFYQYYMPNANSVERENNQITVLQQQKQQLEKEIEKLKIENTLMKELFAGMKK